MMRSGSETSPGSKQLTLLPEKDIGIEPADDVCIDAWLGGLTLPPILTVSEWADQHRILSGKYASEPGPYRTDRTPYLREIQDALSVSSKAERIVVMKGTQVGLTEVGNNWLGYCIHHAPGPFLYVQPNLAGARSASQDRVAPMVADCPELARLVSEPRSKSGGNQILKKEYPGGVLTFAGANSAASLRHRAIRYLFLDEVDGYPMDVGGEGDPVALAMKRTDTFAGVRKIFMASTPTVKGISRIEREFGKSDQRYYEVPCPHCQAYQPILWGAIRWPEKSPHEAHLVCRECGAVIEESAKEYMLPRGRWVATAKGDGRTVGYHLSALYSPLGWYSWAEAAQDFLDARGNREALKAWTNTVPGQTWEEEGQSVDEETLQARVGAYAATVPQDAMVLTCGVDVQDNRVELEVVGWGLGEESWGIDYRVIFGDPAKPALWTKLQDALERKYEHQDGYRLRISCTCIDSGGHYTQQVYKFCKGKQVRGVFAIKGMAGAGYPIVSSPSRKRTGKDRRPVELIRVGTDQARGIVLSRYGVVEQGPGYCHFPEGRGYDHERFRQMTAMKSTLHYSRGIPKRVWYLQSGRRKEAFDCRVYAYAALNILDPNWEALRRRRQRQAAEKAEIERENQSPEQVSSKDGSTPRKKASPRRRGGWVSGWR